MRTWVLYLVKLHSALIEFGNTVSLLQCVIGRKFAITMPHWNGFLKYAFQGLFRILQRWYAATLSLIVMHKEDNFCCTLNTLYQLFTSNRSTKMAKEQAWHCRTFIAELQRAKRASEAPCVRKIGKPSSRPSERANVGTGGASRDIRHRHPYGKLRNAIFPWRFLV